jgi:hypothetical protein
MQILTAQGHDTVAKLLRKLKMPSVRPSITLTIVSLVAFLIFVFGGGIYDMMENPPRILPSPTNPVFWYPGMTEQTFNESVYFAVFLLMGISGGYLIHISSRIGYRPREARMVLLVGAAMMLIATAFSETVLYLKLS